MYLLVDIETTGLPSRRNADPKKTDLYDTARVVSICMKILDQNLDVQSSYEKIIKRNGFNIGNCHIHGITNETSDTRGVDIQDLCDHIDTLDDHLIFISHNVDFDRNVLLSELFRNKKLSCIKKIAKMKTYCTMKNLTDVCKLHGFYGYKYPSLAQAYKYFFNRNIIKCHDSVCDVNSLHEILIEMKKRNLF